MKKLFYLLSLSAAVFYLSACKPDNPVTPPEPEISTEDTTKTEQLTKWEILDTTYTVRDYTVPSHTAFKIAMTACAADSSEANKAALENAIKALVPKTEPYCMVATFNGDPKTCMGFAWFTNEGVNEGEVQLVAKADATEADFASGVITVPATPTTTKKALRYVGQCSYIYTKANLAAGTKYFYVSHKALATNLTPGTEYSWRVGYEGHWSPIAQFRTQDAAQGEFSFIYMSDSHIMNAEYIKYARPLIIGELTPVYVNGLPRHILCKEVIEYEK